MNQQKIVNDLLLSSISGGGVLQRKESAMKTIIRISVFVEKQGEGKEDESIPRSQAEFYVNSEVFFEEQQAQHLASSFVPLIYSAVLDFEEENAPAEKPVKGCLEKS